MIMAKKRKSPANLKARASAKAEIVAKATYQRKRTTTEIIPPDVTRAKAGAWLTLISPITEWAGLKGDALKFKRDLLRIQQEETLFRIAQEVRKRLAGEGATKQIPRKILVPAIEKASLEDVNDDVMVDRWANLLISAAKDIKVQPRFVGILEEMTGKQAECLERIAFNRSENFNFPATIFADSFIEFADYNIRQDFEDAVQSILTDEGKIDEVCEVIENAFSRPGVYLGLIFIWGSGGHMWDAYDGVAARVIPDTSDISILESLGLVRSIVLKCNTGNPEVQTFEVAVHYHHLTNLGVEFCEVCSRPRLDELEQVGVEARKKGLKLQEPFRRGTDGDE